VLILRDLQTHISEVLILGDLQARLLILLDFKSFIISDLIKNERFAEVLILEGLGCAVGRDGWTWAGKIRRDPPAAGWIRRRLVVRAGTGCRRASEPLRRGAGRKRPSGRMPHRSTQSYSMSIYIYELVFE